MRDADDEIREIKTEIIESRGLIIKTNNLTNSLAADIKSIAKRKSSDERRLNLNSWVAYVLMAALSFFGLRMWSNVRINEIEGEKDELTREVKDLRRDLTEETRRAETREQAEASAAAFYRLIQNKERVKVVEGYEAIQDQQLSEAEKNFFRDTADRFRLDLSIAAYTTGLGMMRTGRYSEAAESFHESLRLNDAGAHTPSVKYQLATAYLHLGRYGEAQVIANEVLEQTVDRDLQDDAAHLLSQCAEGLGDIDGARDALRLLMRRWPRSALLQEARIHLSELNKKVWKDPNAGVVRPPR